MHTHNGTLYPMLAVGAFMAMFWAGMVAGHALGLGCFALFATGLLSACLGTIGVCELQRRDRCGTHLAPRHPVSPGARSGVAATASAPRADVPNRRWPAASGSARLRGEPC